MTRSEKSKSTDKAQDELKNLITASIEGGNIKVGRILNINFLRGIFFGIGSVLGGTLGITMIIALLSLFSDFPFIGEFVNWMTDGIKS